MQIVSEPKLKVEPANIEERLGFGRDSSAASELDPGIPLDFGLDIEEATIYQDPHAFIDKRREPGFIRFLKSDRHSELLDMYLAYEPKNSFSGLPPESNEACAAWVDTMLKDALSLVALSFDGGVVGHAALFPMSPKNACEFFVVVFPGYQGIGIGTELTRCAVQTCYELGFDKVWLCVDNVNHAAKHVYRKCGFSYITPPDEDDAEMCLELSVYRDRLKVSIQDIINRTPAYIRQRASCREAALQCLDTHISSLPVVDDDNRLVGIVSATDLLTVTNPSREIGAIVTKAVVTVGEHCTVDRVARLLQSRKLRCIPVVDDHDRLLGIVGRREVLFYHVSRLWADMWTI